MSHPTVLLRLRQAAASRAALLAPALILFLACSSAAAQNLGVTVLRSQPASGSDATSDARRAKPPAPITLFYATDAAETPQRRGPFAFSAAPDASPRTTDPRPVVLISHGSGGNAWTFVDLARHLVQAGFVVAVPQHAGDNHTSQSDVGPPSWRQRPRELSATLDALAADPAWSTRVDVQRAGVFGMSAGGHTALVMAGGVWSEARYGDHCRQHLAADFNTCVGLLTHLDGSARDGFKLALARAALEQRHTDPTPLSHQDPRVRVAVASVPMAVPFEPASLERPRVPLGLLRAAQDTWLHPQFHSDAIAARCLPQATCTMLADWPRGGHGSVLSPWPAGLAREISPLMVDPEGFDRDNALPQAFGAVAAFFGRHLR
ncbi:MAG: alpha/beta hydrolase family protein [Rubrivivax sp.]|jgi:predicted dienelactone hydrolase